MANSPFVSVPASKYNTPRVVVVDGGGNDVSTTYVSFENYDGTPVAGKHVVVRLTADGTGVEDIVVRAL